MAVCISLQRDTLGLETAQSRSSLDTLGPKLSILHMLGALGIAWSLMNTSSPLLGPSPGAVMATSVARAAPG